MLFEPTTLAATVSAIAGLWAVLGLAYRLDWGELTIAQRRLEYDFAPNAVMRKLGFSGIAVGASWRW